MSFISLGLKVCHTNNCQLSNSPNLEANWCTLKGLASKVNSHICHKLGHCYVKSTKVARVFSEILLEFFRDLKYVFINPENKAFAKVKNSFQVQPVSHLWNGLKIIKAK